MQNTFSDFTNTQGYVKLGRCTSTGDLVFLPETANRLSEEPSMEFTDALPYEYLHFDPFLLFNELLADEEIQNMLFKLPECYGFFPKEQFPAISFHVELIFTEFHSKETHYEDSVRGLLLSFLSMITRSFTKENKTGKAA